MSLRRFMVLVRGLSAQSALALHASAPYMGSNRAVREAATPQESEDVLAAMLGVRSRTVH